MIDSIPRVLFLLHLAATLDMVGVIWFVQLVHYPLFARVGPSEFAAFERAHTRFTALVVAPPMLAELVTACLLVWIRPEHLPPWAAIAGLALVAVNWVSTWTVQIPCHDRSTRGYDPAVHRRLVATNWLRKSVWSLRGLLLLGMALQLN
jgi:hypothetical protein